MNRLPIIYNYYRYNRNSFPAIFGALEKRGLSAILDVIPSYDEEDMLCKIKASLRDYSRIILAYSFSTPQRLQIKKELTEIISLDKEKKIFKFAGGPHPTARPIETIQMGFDAVCVGEGEDTFSNFVNAYYHRYRFDDKRGMYLNKNGKISFTGKQNLIDIDRYPACGVASGIFGSIELYRGCRFGCKYCQTPCLMGKKERARSIDNVLKYVRIMIERGLTDIRFLAPNSLGYLSNDGKTANIKELERLLSSSKRMLKNGGRLFFGSFPSEVRPEFVTSEAMQIIKDLCDNDNIIIGAQSGSGRILNAANRGHDVGDIYRATEMVQKNGLKAYVDVIWGLPGEIYQDQKDTLEMAERIISMGAKVHSHHFMPIPGTPWESEKPSNLHPVIRDSLIRMAKEKGHFGEWQIQEMIAKDIYSGFLK